MQCVVAYWQMIFCIAYTCRLHYFAGDSIADKDRSTITVDQHISVRYRALHNKNYVSVEEIYTVGTINNVKTSHFTQLYVSCVK